MRSSAHVAGYSQDGLFTTHNDHFRSDPVFQAAYARGLKASKRADPVFEWRVHVALWAAAASLRLPGDFVECGLNAGFISSAIMHRLQWNALGRRYYLIDTFRGPVLDQYSPEEIEPGGLALAKSAPEAGAYVTDLARVRANFSEWPNSVVVPGSVPEVLPSLDISAVAFLHLDMNCAYPERLALEFFWERRSARAPSVKGTPQAKPSPGPVRAVPAARLTERITPPQGYDVTVLALGSTLP
jgi:hypothetical protein